MPTLRLEDNPPATYPLGAEIADLAALGGTWFLFTSTYNRVKRLAFDLAAQGISYYLPLVQRTIIHKGERRVSLISLFGRYIFVRLQPHQFAESKHIDTTQPILDEWNLLPALAKLKEGIDAGNIRSLCDLKPGKPALVTGGAFKGCTAKVDHIDYDKGMAYLLGLVPNAEAEIELGLLEAV